MGKNILVMLYVLAMIATVVIVDVLYFRHRFWARFVTNVMIVLGFAIFYFVFLRHV